MPNRAFFIRLVAVIISGLIAALLFPPFNLANLVWVCLVPLLGAVWSLDGKHRAKKGFFLGYIAGAISFGIQVSWLSTVSWLGPIVLAAYLALFWGAFGAFAATIGNPWHRKHANTSETPLRSLFIAFTHASFFAGLEWLRGWLFTGFGWNGLGVAFHDTLVISQAADLLGVTGLTFLVVFFQCVLIQAGHRLWKASREGIRRPRWDFAVAALLVGAFLSYGILRIAGESGRESITLKALLVQINIPQEAGQVLWEAERVHMAYEQETISALEAIAQKDEKALQAAIGEGSEGTIELSSPDWVIWPETSLTGRILRSESGEWGAWMQNIDTIARVREAGNFELIYGAVEISGELRDGQLFQTKDPDFYNSIVFQDPDNDLRTFRKRHLVIFGETIPFVDSIPLLKKIYEQQAGAEYTGSFTAGPSTAPIPVELKGTQIQVIPAVCFEDTVPRLTRKFVQDAPQIIVNLTNDGWFKESQAAAQHFANARFRAIELRRPMLRCANTGVTAAIDTLGSTINPETGLPQVIQDKNGSTFLRGSLLAKVQIPLYPSFSLYALIGDWGIILLGLAGLLSQIIDSRLARNRPVEPLVFQPKE